MHTDLMALSTVAPSFKPKSSRFVWLDQSEIIIQPVELLLRVANSLKTYRFRRQRTDFAAKDKS